MDIGELVKYIESLKFEMEEDAEDIVVSEEQLRNDEVKEEYTRSKVDLCFGFMAF